MPIPTIPSNQYIPNMLRIIEINVKVVTIQSFLWSCFKAFISMLSVLLIKNLVYTKKYQFNCNCDNADDYC